MNKWIRERVEMESPSLELDYKKLDKAFMDVNVQQKNKPILARDIRE